MRDKKTEEIMKEKIEKKFPRKEKVELGRWLQKKLSETKKDGKEGE